MTEAALCSCGVTAIRRCVRCNEPKCVGHVAPDRNSRAGTCDDCVAATLVEVEETIQTTIVDTARRIFEEAQRRAPGLPLEAAWTSAPAMNRLGSVTWSYMSSAQGVTLGKKSATADIEQVASPPELRAAMVARPGLVYRGDDQSSRVHGLAVDESGGVWGVAGTVVENEVTRGTFGKVRAVRAGSAKDGSPVKRSAGLILTRIYMSPCPELLGDIGIWIGRTYRDRVGNNGRSEDRTFWVE